MLRYIIISVLLSFSPFGEAKAGIPYALLKGVDIYLALGLCLAANIAVYPVMLYFLKSFNRYFFRWNTYKKSAVFVARRAKNGAQKKIQKYGFWGLVFFVMIPLPGTGVYAGTIVSYIFRFDEKKSFLANTLGITISSIIVWFVTITSMNSI